MPSAVLAQESTNNTAETTALPLSEAVRISLRNNLGLRIDRFGPAYAEQDSAAAQALFDPLVSAAIEHSETESPPEPTTSSDRASYSAAVSKTLSTGATVTASTALNRASPAFVSGEYDADASLTIRQPLAQGMGRKVTLAGIESARLGLEISRWQLRGAVLDVLTATEQAYWELAYARAFYESLQSGIALARKLLREAEEKRRVGLATELDYLRAQASLASRQRDLISAGQSIHDAEDSLRIQMGLLRSGPGASGGMALSEVDTMSFADEYGLLGADPGLAPAEMVTENSAVPGQIIVNPLPEETVQLPQFLESWNAVYAFDIPSQQQFLSIAQREIDVRLKRDNLKPTIDLVVSGGWLGEDDSSGPAYRSAWEREGSYWSAGVEMTWPWGNRAEKAAWRQARIDLRREEMRLGQLRQNLMRSTRFAWRSINTGNERVAAADAALRLQEKTYQQETEKYNAGLSTVLDVLQTQQEYDQARIEYIDALLRLVAAEIDLARLDGSILNRYGIGWSDIDALAYPASAADTD